MYIFWRLKDPFSLKELAMVIGFGDLDPSEWGAIVARTTDIKQRIQALPPVMQVELLNWADSILIARENL